MELTKNTWHYKFWKVNYCYWRSDEPNNNFCDYFWELVLAFVLLPITWISVMFKLMNKDKGKLLENIAITLVCYIAIFFLIVLGIGVYQQPLMFLYVIGGVVGIILLAIGIFFSINKINKSQNIVEINSIVSEGWKRFKGKYCPKITWK